MSGSKPLLLLEDNCERGTLKRLRNFNEHHVTHTVAQELWESGAALTLPGSIPWGIAAY